MKAIVWTRYGPPSVLEFRDVEKPSPKDNEVRIRVHAATVTLADCEMRSLNVAAWLRLPLRLMMGLTKPKGTAILGQELAGDIEAVGSAVTRFKVGDQVFAPAMLHLGAYAEYVCLPEAYPVLKPAGMTYEEAATIPTGGINGLHFVRAGHVQSGESVLINGAGGSIGTYAVQIAKALGAAVTAVDSAQKLAMLRSIGAGHVMDYRQADFTKTGETYDVIIDVVGKSSFSGSIKALNAHGRYVLGNPSLSGMIKARWMRTSAGKQVIVAIASYKAEYYTFLTELMEAGKLKAIIDRRYPLQQTAEAHRYVEEGHKQGNVIITVVPE